jgi:pimeloyl-ACP methyl ester carboxylesterase
MIWKTCRGIGFAAGRWPFDGQRPTLVFIHGSGGDHRLWAGQCEALLDAANTMALDLPGHGASGGPGCERVADYAVAVTGLLEALRPPRPVPCGLSLGGAIVLQLLLERQTSLVGAVLMGTGARLRVRPEIFDTIASDYEGFGELLVRTGASPTTPCARLAAVAAAAAACPPDVTAGDFRACDRFDVMDRLDRIDRPVLVVSGAEDQLTPPKYSAFLEQQIAHSRRILVPQAGHLVPVEQPEIVNQSLRQFVKDLSA